MPSPLVIAPVLALVKLTKEEIAAAAIRAADAIAGQNPDPSTVFSDADIYTLASVELPRPGARLTPAAWVRLEIADVSFKSFWRERVLRTAGRLPVRVVGVGFRILAPDENIDAAEGDALERARRAFAKARHILKWTRDELLDGVERQRKASVWSRLAVLDGFAKTTAEAAARSREAVGSAASAATLALPQRNTEGAGAAAAVGALEMPAGGVRGETAALRMRGP